VQAGNLFNPQARFIATSMEDAQETPSTLIPGGVFVTRVYTRVPTPGPKQ